MPSDIKYGTDRDLEIDPTGDIGIVTGRDNLQQQHLNAIFRAVDSVDPDLNSNNIKTELREAIINELEETGYVENAGVGVSAEPPNKAKVIVETEAVELEEEVSL